MDQARAPKARIWRKKKEGLTHCCTGKGSHVGSGGRVLKLMVGISYGNGVVLCEQYEKLDGQKFHDFVLDHFNDAFEKSHKGNYRIFVQDGDPCQNSAKAKAAFVSINATLLSIPPRSPDLNPIENLFHLVKNDLAKQAVEQQIVHETFREFAIRVKNLMHERYNNVIDNIISSMNKRLDMIIKSKGDRTKY